MFALKISICILLSLVSFLLQCKNTLANVTSEQKVETQLSYSKNDDVVYGHREFKGAVYAFLGYDNCTIQVHKTVNGTEWEKKNDVKTSGTSTGTVYSIFTTEQKMILIFKCDNKFYITQCGEGLVWSTPKLINVSNLVGTDTSPAVYSGSLLSMNNDFEKYILVCENHSQNYINVQNEEYMKEIRLLGKCLLSFDEGKTWRSELMDLYSDEGYTKINTLRLSDYGGKILVKGTNAQNLDKTIKSIILLCSNLHDWKLFCALPTIRFSKDISVENMAHFNTYHLAIVKEQNKLKLTFTYDLFETFDPQYLNIEFEGDSHYFVLANDQMVYLFYRGSDKKIYVVKIKTPPRKIGCELTTDNTVNKLYTYTYKHIFNNSISPKTCKVPSSQLKHSSDGLYKLFEVRLPNDVKVTDNCFRYSFLSDLNSKYHTTIIKTKTIKKLENYIEVQFQFPTYYTKFLYNYKSAYCVLSNNYRIVVEFDYIHNHIDLDFPFETTTVNLYSNDSVKHAFRNNTDESHKHNFPKGTYMTSYFSYEKEYIISNYIENNFPTSFTILTQRKMNANFIAGGEKYIYEGIDLADSSPNYKLSLSSVPASQNVDIFVSKFDNNKTLGFVCPVKSSYDGLNCFDNVYIKNKTLVKIEYLFGGNDIFVVPQRRIYKQEGTAMESLLYLNENNVKKLKEDKSIIHFYCECNVNNKLVKVNYYISPYYDENSIKQEMSKKDEEKPIINKSIPKNENEIVVNNEKVVPLSNEPEEIIQPVVQEKLSTNEPSKAYIYGANHIFIAIISIIWLCTSSFI
ncbi:6-cysteine protein [Plasmodium sp. gorilla clade G2]|uniref:6-cysteine protein n=1 Tax=Plasmodium sp. gorilla clade G2 TaxID=880535 RepID=UPI000D21F7FB|nr:6-cysteine protein [Plasmodium sp. gorilla clade G2]SOV18460.1 6-cysteine protein [Plasmodium sp. gorilla clade G2]